MSFVEPKVRVGNKTLTQSELAERRKRNRQRNAERYNAKTRFVKDEAYSNFYKSKAWRNKRKEVLLRDKYMCQECLRNGIIKNTNSNERFYVHHIVEIKDDWDKRLDINNLETVCGACHNEIHRRRQVVIKKDRG